MDHMSLPFLRRISDTGSNTFMVSSLYTQLRLRVASQKGEASQAPDTSSCVSGSGTRRLLQEGELQPSQLRSHCQTKKIATWGRNIRPNSLICKASINKCRRKALLRRLIVSSALCRRRLCCAFERSFLHQRTV